VQYTNLGNLTTVIWIVDRTMERTNPAYRQNASGWEINLVSVYLSEILLVMKRLFWLITLLILQHLAFSQSVYAPLSPEYNHLVDRQEILNGRTSLELHTSFKPYLRDAVYKMSSRTEADTLAKWNKKDRFNARYLKDDNLEWADSADTSGNSRRAIFRVFYKKKNSFLSYQHPEFMIQANPVFNVWGGKENKGLETNFMNSRGAEIRGLINQRIGFYSVITTTQTLQPGYVRERINGDPRAIPGEAYFKPYQTNGVDYFSARGYVTFKLSKNIRFQFGHDRNFIGNGYRSLILSDNSAPYLFGKIQTKIWKINYTNLYGQMFYNTNIGKDTTYSRKFLTLHHLSLNIGKHINVGVFESIVYTRANNQFDVNYLNPIIFYRSVETYMGSSDKATLGLDLKINFLRHLSFYGQMVLNEFRIKEFTGGKGWWGNKYALQLGLKYIDAFGAKNFDLQGEVNMVRPYTYTSIDGKSNYSHYNQALAHPLGANFTEVIGIARYQAQKRVNIQLKVMLARMGLDSVKVKPGNFNNYGGNIYKPYEDVFANRSYGNSIGQGVTTNILYAELGITYMVRHNIFIDLMGMIRQQFTDKNDPLYRRETSFASLGIRMNLWQRPNVF
jgi:hypothetical protein